LAINVSGIVALIPVVPTYTVVGAVVVPPLSVHWTAEHGTKPLPITVRENAPEGGCAVPAAALFGMSEVMAGTGSKLAAVIMEKVRELEVIVGELDTEIVADPWKAVSVAEIVAASCVALTNVVGRGDPFQFTTSPFTKSVPFTVNVKPVVPQYGIEDGTRVVMVGATIWKVIPLEMPPPAPPLGVGVDTLTRAVPTLLISATGIGTTSCVVLTNVVAGLVMLPLASFHWTPEQGTKLIPVTFKLNAAVPAVTRAGESEVMAGRGSELGDVMEKLKGADVTADGKLTTEIIAAVSSEVVSVGGIPAVSCTALTNVVGRGDPFQLTTDPLTKFVPFTVRVKPAGLQYDVEDAEIEVTVGAEIVNVAPTDVPPPGPSVNKKTVASPAARKSAAGTIALRYAGTVFVAGTYVLASVLFTLLPFACHCTTVHGRMDVASTLSVDARPPAAA
jgi:hypothetical protein